METNKLKKMLLMGQHKAGKTSMHSIIFANTPPKEVVGIGLTVDVNQNQLRFMGNHTLNLWDCGGQDLLMKQYFTTQKEQIFSDCEVLIYVFDVEKENDAYTKEKEDYVTTITNIATYSPGARVFILIHKFDKIREQDREAVFKRKFNDIHNISNSINIQIQDTFQTSIWDDTLYKAWSSIVQNQIPHIQQIKESLVYFCDTCNCDEIVLFEKFTFLIIAFHEVKNKQKDIMKYERLSNIIKQFKLSCLKVQSNIQTIQVKNNKFTTYIDQFTDNTFIMLVYSDNTIQPASIIHNINQAKILFDSVVGADTEKLRALAVKN